MDTYNPDTVFSSIDTYGRYAYKNQPKIGAWNVARFAETLIPLINKDSKKAIQIAENSIKNYSKVFNDIWISGMRRKLGLFNEEDNDIYLINNLLKFMEDNKADYTNTFYYLTTGELNENKIKMFGKSEFKQWLKVWQSRVNNQNKSEHEIKILMEENNPVVIPRNEKVEEALEAAINNDYSKVNKLLQVIKRPFDYKNINEEYTRIPKSLSRPYKTYCGT